MSVYVHGCEMYKAEKGSPAPLAMAPPGAEVFQAGHNHYGLLFQLFRRWGGVTGYWSRVSVFLGGVPLLLGDLYQQLSR